MAYKRNSHYRGNSQWDTGNFRSKPTKVDVTIMWDNMTNAGYILTFATSVTYKDKNTGETKYSWGDLWPKIEAIVGWLKGAIPSSQREWIPEHKSWFIAEKYFNDLRDILNTIPEFDVNVVEKPQDAQIMAFHSKEDDYNRFKQILSLAGIDFPDTTDLKVATKFYRRAAMELHPDRNPQMYEYMSELNEVWSRLKPQTSDTVQSSGYFK